VRGLVLMAPHFFTEPEGLAEIRNAKQAYETTDLRARLARHHADVDVAFRGWNDAWLDPGFPEAFEMTEALAYIRVPILIIQGEDDRYGTAKQLQAAREECYCPVETLLLPACGHAPHRDKPAETLEATGAFVDRILRLHGEAAQMQAA
jgi:pimeloyl-ACP methyl ester carboxylesterase